MAHVRARPASAVQYAPDARGSQRSVHALALAGIKGAEPRLAQWSRVASPARFPRAAPGHVMAAAGGKGPPAAGVKGPSPGAKGPSAGGKGAPTGGKGPGDGSAPDKKQLVTKKLARAGKSFKKLGYFSFWCQLILSVVSTVVLVFSVAVGGANTAGSGPGLYLTLFGLLAAFLSTFWSFGFVRLGTNLQKLAPRPEEAPSRAQVVKNLTSGVTINVLGLGAAILGLEIEVGLLVAKTLTSATANPFTAGLVASYNPVLALDVFLVQASTNAIMSHFVSLALSLWLLRSVATPGSRALAPVGGAAKASAA